MDSNLAAIAPSPFGKPGDKVPEVDFADLKVMWTHAKETQTRYPGKATGVDFLQTLCSLGADVMAVVYRCSMLQMLELYLEAVWFGGQLSDNALKAAAKVEMEWMAVGVFGAICRSTSWSCLLGRRASELRIAPIVAAKHKIHTSGGSFSCD